MAEQKISTYLAYSLIFAAFMAGIGLLIGEINSEYGLTTSTAFADTFGATAELTNSTSGLTSYINQSANDANAVSFVLNSFATPVRLLLATFNFFASLIGDLVSEVPLISGYGAILGEVVMSLFVIGIILLIFSVIFRWRMA